VIAAQSPADCFAAAYEAARIAVEFRTPVILLSDGFLANSSEPWQVPQLSELPEIRPDFATEPNRPDGRYWPYLRDERLARSWAIPGTPGLEHRVGGLEKADGSGGISYDPANHEAMVRLRQAKLERVIELVPDLQVDDPDGTAELLVLGWGSSYGPIQAAARKVREAGHSVAIAGLRHLNPLPGNLGEVLRGYRKVIVPELNLGQLTMLLRARYLVDVTSYSKVAGLPLSQAELAADLISIIKEDLR
jgi:2-oxoglutarate ferredoxin oxidoreductase subunit alpha